MIRKIHVFQREIAHLNGAPSQLQAVRAAVLSDNGLVRGMWTRDEWAALVGSAPVDIEFTEAPNRAPEWALQ